MARGFEDKKRTIGRRVGIVIGRFQPFHKAHKQMVEKAVAENDKVIVVVGSAGKAPDVKNPFNETDRVQMIAMAMGEDAAKLNFATVRDYYDNNQWLFELKRKISQYLEKDDHIDLYGHDKDDSTFYLNLFPDWGFVEVGQLEGGVNATLVRDFLFDSNEFVERIDLLEDYLPEGTTAFINNWLEGQTFKILKEEYEALAKYKEPFENLVYTPTFVTVDAVVVYKGKVMTIKRKASPGNGLQALVGGFPQADEKLLDGVVRIVKQKTGLELRKSNIVASKVYDKPDRSLRGRTITHAYRFDIPNDVDLNLHTGKVEWMDYLQVHENSNMFFEDHSQIIIDML